MLQEDTLYYSYEFLFYASILSVLAPPIYIAIFQDAIFFERALSLSIFLKVPYETYQALVVGKSSRTLFAMKVSEVVLESVPQLMIQIYMLLPALANAEPLQTALIVSISSALFNTTATFVEGYEGKYIAAYEEQIVPTTIAYLYHGTSLVFRFLPLLALSMAKGGYGLLTGIFITIFLRFVIREFTAQKEKLTIPIISAVTDCGWKSGLAARWSTFAVWIETLGFLILTSSTSCRDLIHLSGLPDTFWTNVSSIYVMACVCGVAKTTLYFGFIENIHHRVDAKTGELRRRNYNLKAMPAFTKSALWRFLGFVGIVEVGEDGIGGEEEEEEKNALAGVGKGEVVPAGVRRKKRSE